jgi:Nucleotidyl transferase AbiEii toxin, Type IV TA system
MKGGVSDYHRQVVSAVLPVLDGYGFALAGGNALLAHGISQRPTMDVNLFTDRKGVVPAVAEAVESALRARGFHVERIDVSFSDLLERVPDLANHRAEWTVARGGEQVILQITGGEPRTRPPVTMDLGPVLAPQDVLASKVCALATRAEARDFIDVWAALSRYSPEELITLAWKLEPGFTTEDFTHIGAALDLLDDGEFTRYGLTHADIAELRERFASWPRRRSAR